LDNLIKQDIKEINEDALRAAGLTKQLLAFSRKQMLQPTTINLNSVVRSMEKMLKRLIGERIKLKIHLEPQLLNIKADVSQIEQVIMNLVINSRDAIKSSGEITISTSAENLPEENNKSHILLKVKDNGMGMDEDTQKRIFEPFFSTKKETKKGTGLGLSTVYGIIIQSGGKINFESTKETGTTFKIYFPSTEESIHNKTKNHELLIKKHNGTAMIVEDEDSVRRLAGRALIEKGYKVIEAKNGIQALQLCKKNIGAIDLLLTDVVMPKINGREVAEKFLLSYKDIKVLYMSGYTEDNSFLKEILEEGAHFLPKPFSPQTLTTKVQQLLNSNN
ncbi:MAG: ATP-binding protein, partial [Elusimicrobiota bacterium]